MRDVHGGMGGQEDSKGEYNAVMFVPLGAVTSSEAELQEGATKEGRKMAVKA